MVNLHPVLPPVPGGAVLTIPAAGQVLAVDRAGVHVACGEGVVCVAELQVVGGKRMPAQAYAAGKPFAAGERLVDPPTPAE